MHASMLPIAWDLAPALLLASYAVRTCSENHANDAHLKHLAKYVAEDEISHCVSFAALWSANNKRAKGLRASGLGSVSCSRHEMFRAGGTGDLQAGKVGTKLLGTCQENAPRNAIARLGTHHIQSTQVSPSPHVKCHGPYSFNYTKGVGRTDGEGVERNWSWLNRAARFISVMGPGSRDDTLDDLCGWGNWRKTVDLGPRVGIAGLGEAGAAWDEDNEKPNPYEYPEVEAETMADVMLRISKDEHARVAEQGAAALLVKPSAFLMAGIDIEEDQVVVAQETKRKTRTTIQATALQRQRTILLGKVSALHDVQESYMPGLRRWVGQQNPPLPAADNSKPETIKIYLPSSIPADAREAVCVPGLVKQEDELRNAQAVEGCVNYEVGVFTKSRTLTDGIEDRIRAASARYRTARAALLLLRGPGDWETTLKVLEKGDIRGMNERAMNDEEKEENRKACLLAGLSKDGNADELDDYGEPVELTVLFNLETGEGHRQLSWIWYTAPSTRDKGADGKLHDDIRVEWMKARGRAERWREELLFVEAEMERVLEFCRWKSRWWKERLAPSAIGGGPACIRAGTGGSGEEVGNNVGS
ncbi:hypothetical protein B0H13DRAFT_1908834 [Mycena leptocephala]|nr:hypothetical protein B0H13DRAFT_1908834 [Mycena leptocephala]